MIEPEVLWIACRTANVLYSRFKSFPGHGTATPESNKRAEEVLRGFSAGKFAEVMIGKANITFSSKSAERNFDSSNLTLYLRSE